MGVKVDGYYGLDSQLHSFDRAFDSLALASVLGALDTAVATGAVTDVDEAMAYIKQLVTELQVMDALVDAITAAGPTKVEMDSGHALLATPAQVATALTNYDPPTATEMTAEHTTLQALIIAMGG